MINYPNRNTLKTHEEDAQELPEGIFNRVSKIVNNNYILPSLNVVSCFIIPGRDQFCGGFESNNGTQFGQQTLIETPYSKLPDYLLQGCQHGYKNGHFGSTDMAPDVHNHREKYFQTPFPKGLKISNDLNFDKNIHNYEFQKSKEQDSSRKSSMYSEKFKGAAKSESLTHALSEKRWCTCGLTHKQSFLVERVMTSTNMRFLNDLKEYDYVVEDDRSNPTNTKGYKFICKFRGSCNKEFTRPWNLLDHCRMHRGVKPFGCYICGKKFTQKGNRNKHMQRHK